MLFLETYIVLAPPIITVMLVGCCVSSAMLMPKKLVNV